jgi:hypothetical protein
MSVAKRPGCSLRRPPRRRTAVGSAVRRHMERIEMKVEELHGPAFGWKQRKEGTTKETLCREQL